MTEPAPPPDLEALQTRLEYRFANVALLQLALTHPSVAHEQGRLVQHNQRLEFLGDAVLGLVLTRELYDRFPAVSEGPLTKARAQMINRRTLTDQARRIQLSTYLILSRGEEANEGRQRASAMADAFEAVIGAIFLDGGFEAAREFVLRSFRDAFGEKTSIPTLDNPKGELQEILQAKSPDAPQYSVLRASGPDHDRDFECVVTHAGIELGRGRGKSKKAAESEAAIAALKKVRAETA
ncbi:MAG TPA: ribonuclease III [Verrucomicrobiae bacterium]|jgi:ribonuclease-3|nr:ribonuclease III [Verrucomicrobiae bacterium]